MILRRCGFLFFAFCAIVSLWFAGCGDDAPETTDAASPSSDAIAKSVDPLKYKDWVSYSFKNIRIIYPPDHRFAENIPGMAAGYDFGVRADCNFLGIAVPTDTLTIYFYDHYAKAHTMTGHVFPFVYSDTIHFWYPNFYGVSLLDCLLPRWNSTEPTHRFLREGLRALLDYSGNNYHEITHMFLHDPEFADTGFVPLAEIAVDTTVDVYAERHQSSLSASFVDFVIYTYGMDKFKQFYDATDPFNRAVERTFDISVDSIETVWLHFVETVADSTAAAGSENK